MPGLTLDQLALYKKDMYKAEREAYDELPLMHNKIFKVVTGVTGAGDKNSQLLGAGDLTRHTAEGQDINFKSPASGWEFLVKYWTYSDGLSFTYEAVEDTVKLGNLLTDLADSWGLSHNVAEETMGSTVFNRGGDLLGEWVFNGSHAGNTATYGDMLYDNKPLFNLTGNARAIKSQTTGTYYNSVASLTLTAANFETLYILHTSTNNVDERGRIKSNPCDTLLTRAGADFLMAKRIIQTSGMNNALPGSQLNDMNPYSDLIQNVWKWDYLSDTSSPFYIGKAASKDFQFHKRQAPTIRFFRDERNAGYKASIIVRMGVLIKNWRTWSRGGGTSA